MKNLMGVLGGNRGIYHGDIHSSIVDFNKAIKVHLVIMDATRILLRHGPNGGTQRDVRETKTIVFGTNPVTVDAFTATLFGMKCEIFMGVKDMERQSLNVYRMNLLGATVHGVESGTGTLKDAINEAMRNWASNVGDTYYLIGSTMGPHPYPMMVRDFQKVIGQEIRSQLQKREGRLPDCVVA